MKYALYLLKWFIELLFIINFKIQRALITKALYVHPRTYSLLKNFLLLDHQTRQLVIAKASVPLLDGIHPKNVYNYRAEFFFNNVMPDDVVVDIGCGTGVILFQASCKIRKGYGIDYSDENLRICRQMHSSDNLEYFKEDILTLDYNAFGKKYRFTVAFFSHILEHIQDVQAFLIKVNAKKVLICVPSIENWIAQLKINQGIFPFSDPTHYREYTRKDLLIDLKKAGYVVNNIGFNAEGEIICTAQKL